MITMHTKAAFDARDVLAAVGVAAVVYGVSQWSEPAAFVLFGLLCLALWAVPYVRVGGSTARANQGQL
jgi:hypothetical protein